MRHITARFPNDCRACGRPIEVGTECYHEKRVGLFCIGCEPQDAEALRAYRQEAADQRDQRLTERAQKRRAEAQALRKRDEHLFRDHAFNTQPGHIPGRKQAIERRNKAAQLEAEADELERPRRKARVRGDAAARDEARREHVRGWIAPGMRVDTAHFGVAEVVKVNRKSARIRTSSGSEFSHDLIFLRQVEETPA